MVIIVIRRNKNLKIFGRGCCIAIGVGYGAGTDTAGTAGTLLLLPRSHVQRCRCWHNSDKPVFLLY